MHKKANVFSPTGPMQGPGLEKNDISYGMDTANIEESAYSQVPTDSSHRSVGLTEKQNGDVDSKTQDEVLGKKRKSKVGDVVVKEAPSRMSSEDKAMSIYSKIMNALKRHAADSERVKTQEEIDAEQNEEQSEAVLDDDPLADSERAVREREEAFKLEQERRRREESESRVGDIDAPASESVRTEGPEYDIGDFPVEEKEPGSPGEASVNARADEIIDIRNRMIEVLDKYVTAAEVGFRHRANRKLLLQPIQDLIEGTKQIKKSFADKMTSEVIRIVNLIPGKRSIPILPDEGQTGSGVGPPTGHGATAVVSTVSIMRGVKTEDIVDIIFNEESFNKFAETVDRKNSDAGEKIRRIRGSDPEGLKDTMKMFLKYMEDKATEIHEASAKVDNAFILESERAEDSADSMARVLARAGAYRQNLSSIAEAEGHKLTESELEVEQERADILLASVRASLEVISQIATGSSKKSSISLPLVFRREGAISINDMHNEYIGMVSEYADIVSGIISAGASEEMISELERDDGEFLEIVSEVGDVFSSIQEVSTSDGQDVSDEPEVVEEKEGIIERLKRHIPDMSSVIPPLNNQQLSPALGAEELKFLRDAVKSKGDGKSKFPSFFGEDPNISFEDLKKQKVSPEGRRKLDESRDYERKREERTREKIDSKEETNKFKGEHDARVAAYELSKVINIDILEGVTQSAQKLHAQNAEQEKAKGIFDKAVGEALKRNEDISENIPEGEEIYGIALTKSGVGYNIVGLNKKKLAGPYDSREEALEASSMFYHKKYSSAEASMRSEMLELNNMLLSVYQNLYDEAAIANDEVKRAKQAVIITEEFHVVVDATKKSVILEDAGIISILNSDIAPALRAFQRANLSSPDVIKVAIKLLRKFVGLAGNFNQRMYVRANGADTLIRDKVSAEMAPLLEIIEERAPEAAEEVASPVLTEGTPGDVVPDKYIEQAAPEVEAQEPDDTVASSNGLIHRESESSDIFDGYLDEEYAAIKEIEDMVPEVTEASEVIFNTIKSYAQFADEADSSLRSAISTIESALSSESSGVDTSEEQDTSEDSTFMGYVTDLLSGPGEPMDIDNALTASAPGSIERTAGEYDKFDTSMNKLEVVVGEDGKKTLVINRGLKNLVSKRVQDMFYGNFKCGDTVQVDFSDYLGIGTVKAYIGNRAYRVEVNGSVMEVPADKIKYISGNPFR